MSAFYDIWIGDKAPVYKRRCNGDWQHAQGRTWISTPGNTDFITQAEDGKYILLLLGQLYENISNRELLQRCTRYIESQGTGFNDPAGHYIIFVASVASGDTYVFTNRTGSYHAYWSDERTISTGYLALAKSNATKKLDWQGIIGFMAMGYFPGDTTWLEGIRIFEPASFYHFDKDLALVTRKRYWTWTYEPTHQPPEGQMENLRAIVQSSLSVAVNNKRAAIPISGGLDSRMLAGELTAGVNSYKSLSGVSYGYANDSPEISIAKRIAEVREIALHAYTVPNYLFAKIDEIAEAVELFQYVDGTRQASAVDWLQANTDVVVGGHWGDVWMNNMNVATHDELLPAFQNKIIKKGSTWLLDNICNTHLANSGDYLSDYFRSFINQYNTISDADFVMTIYKTDQWSFRWTTASLRMYQAGAMPVLPFYDKRLVDFFCTIPTAAVKDRGLQIAYLKRYHSDLAKITWQEYGANLYNYRYINNRNLAYRAIKKTQSLVLNRKPVQRNWELFYLDPKGRQNLEKHLLNNRHLEDIVPKEKITQLLDNLYRYPTAANGYAVSMLLTFAIFLNEVFE